MRDYQSSFVLDVIAVCRRSVRSRASLFGLMLASATVISGGCAGGPSLGPLVATGSLPAALVLPQTNSTATVTSTSTASTPIEANTAPSPATATIPLPFTPNLARVELPPIDVYSRIARHSRGCWFGADGILDASHVFHADAAPAEKGGRVVVSVHERVVGGKSIWGPRAFEIALSPAGDATDVAMQSIKLGGERSSAMSRDVEAWMHDRPSCALRAATPAITASGPPLPVRRPMTAAVAKRQPAGRQRKVR